MLRKVVIAAAALLAVSVGPLAAGVAHAAPADPAPAKASPVKVTQFEGKVPAADGVAIQENATCRGTGVGLLCIGLDRYSDGHEVTVWYEKWEGAPVKIGLGYTGIYGEFHHDNGEFYISRGELKGFVWRYPGHPYWGNGCFDGFIWQGGPTGKPTHWTGAHPTGCVKL